MSGERWSSFEDETIKMLFDKLFPIEIAVFLPGRTHKAVLHRCKALGLRMSGESFGKRIRARFDNDMEIKLGEPIHTFLRRRYIDEKATYRELCAELGVNTRTLMRRMKAFGIEPISSSEAALRQMDKDPDAIKRMQAPDAQRRRAAAVAKTRQRDWQTFSSKSELELLAAMREAGLLPVPQLAIEGYNVDFAFPDAMLAVEHDPCWHDNKASDKRRDARLRELGWTVLRLESRTSDTFNVAKVSAALQSLAATQPR